MRSYGGSPKRWNGVDPGDLKVPAQIVAAAKDKLKSNEVAGLELAAERVAGVSEKDASDILAR